MNSLYSAIEILQDIADDQGTKIYDQELVEDRYGQWERARGTIREAKIRRQLPKFRMPTTCQVPRRTK